MPLLSKARVIKVTLLCILWYAVSSCSNVMGKIILNQFPYPVTLTFSRLLSATLYSLPIVHFGKLEGSGIARSYYRRLVLPLAACKCLASVFSHISIWKVPVSYAHTVKASLPLFTVIFTRVLLREKQRALVYSSLIPIITGVGIATVTELAFDVLGLMAALAATCGFSLTNIFTKKLMRETAAHSFVVLSVLSRLSMLIFFPFWLLLDVRNMLGQESSVESLGVNWRTLIMLLVMDGILSYLQNVLAFGFLSMVTPLTYAVANASKRLAIIGLSLLVLGNSVTAANVMGISLALAGVLLYTRAKHTRDPLFLMDDGMICVCSICVWAPAYAHIMDWSYCWPL